MRRVTVFNVTRAVALGQRVSVADTHWTRLRGLLGRPPLERGEGLLLRPCQAVHMFGMKHAIDVAFVDGDHTVVATYPGLAPGHRSGWHRAARGALELPEGTLDSTGTQVGDRLTIQPAGDGALDVAPGGEAI